MLLLYSGVVSCPTSVFMYYLYYFYMYSKKKKKKKNPDANKVAWPNTPCCVPGYCMSLLFSAYYLYVQFIYEVTVHQQT